MKCGCERLRAGRSALLDSGKECMGEGNSVLRVVLFCGIFLQLLFTRKVEITHKGLDGGLRFKAFNIGWWSCCCWVVAIYQG